MPASAGTPNALQKLAVLGGWGAAIGMTPDEIAATQQGEQRDFTTAEQGFMVFISPILNAAETAGATDGLGDLTAFLTAIAGLGSVTSVGQATNIVSAALSAEAGTLEKQAIAIGQTTLSALIASALAKVGKTNLPLVG